MSTECCIRLLSAAFLSVLKDLWRILNFVKKIEHLSSVDISKEISMRLVQCLSRIHFSGGGVGRGIKTSRFSYLTFSCSFILGFLPVALVYRLQNTKNYGVNLSPSHFFLSPFPYPPLLIFSRYSASLSSLPTFPQKVILLLPGDHLRTMKFLNILFERASDLP